jgi:hypothetical protein
LWLQGIKFDNILDEDWGVKSSFEEESNNSLKPNEEGLTKDKNQVLLTSCSCFTILTKTLLFLALGLFLRVMSKTTANNVITPTTTHCLLLEEVIGIWYTKFKTKLLESFETSLDICNDLN